jgi:hypothetical protein
VPRGKPQGQRTDLNQVAAGTTEYGDRQATEEGMAQVPVANPSGGGGFPTPDSVPNPGDASALPGEPIQAGLSMGPGGGPETVAAQGSDQTIALELRALYAQYPTKDLQRLIGLLGRQ